MATALGLYNGALTEIGAAAVAATNERSSRRGC